MNYEWLVGSFLRLFHWESRTLISVIEVYFLSPLCYFKNGDNDDQLIKGIMLERGKKNFKWLVYMYRLLARLTIIMESRSSIMVFSLLLLFFPYPGFHLLLCVCLTWPNIYWLNDESINNTVQWIQYHVEGIKCRQG